MDFSDLSQLPTVLQAVITHQDLLVKQTLFRYDEAATRMYAVKSGSIRLLHYTESGQVISHHQVKTGEVFAETILFRETYACEAIAEEPTRVMIFPKQSFLAALQQDSTFAMAFVRQVTDRLYLTKVLLESRSIRSARERVLHYLRLSALKQNTIVLGQPLKNIAYDLGLSPEVLSRTLTQLEKEGLIERDRRKITLLR